MIMNHNGISSTADCVAQGVDGQDRLPHEVVDKVLELIRKDDVRSVSCPFNDPALWRGLVAEQVRRSMLTALPLQEAFTLCGPDGGMSDIPFAEWGGRLHLPYEGMCGGDLVLLPLWRKFFLEEAEDTGRLSTAAWLCCHYLLSPRDYGEVGFATRTPVGGWVLYESKAPYVPCDPLDQRKCFPPPGPE
jgi:hypothetical protein